MRTSEAARMIGVSKQTLILWEMKGYIANHKTFTGQRWYTVDDVKAIQAKMGYGKRLNKPRLEQQDTRREPLKPHNPQQAPASVPQHLEVDWNAVERCNEKELWAWFSTQPNQMELVHAAPNERLSSDLAYMLSQGHQLPDADMALHPGIAYPSGGD